MSTIKEAINKCVGNDEEIKRQRELLTLLSEASEARAKLMVNDLQTYIRTAGTEENKSIPVTDILADYQEIRVSTEESMADIPGKIKSAISNIISGNILDGVISLIGDTLSALIGSSSSAEVTKRQYFVAVEGLSMIRYDVFYWTRSITVESIKKSAEKSIICIMTKSSIDVEKLKFNTFLNIYQTLLKSKQDITSDELINAINEAKKVYKTLVGNLETPLLMDLNEVTAVEIDNLGDYLTTFIAEVNPNSQWPEIN